MDLVPLLSDASKTMQVPLPPRSPVVHSFEFTLLTLHLPVTVAPFTGSPLASCTVISTVADQVFPLLNTVPSRLPTWIGVDGAFTATVVEAWLFAPLSSVKSWLFADILLVDRFGG